MVSPYLDRDLQEGLEFVQEKMKKNICFKLLRKMSQFTYEALTANSNETGVLFQV